MSILLTLSLLISVAFGRVTIDHLEKERVPDEYVITYHENTTVGLAEGHWSTMESYGVEFIHKYNTPLHKGFAAKITDAKVLDLLQEDPMVMAIEANVIFKLDQLDCGTSRPAPSWGLSRISSQTEQGSGFTYNYGDFDGKGVNVYIIDTGILISHNDFGGRASYGINYITNEGTRDDADDWNGHGTHCAGTATGTEYGVAKGANVVAVKVLNSAGSGTFADVVAGVDFVPSDSSRGGPKVSSMSLGAQGTYAALSTAVRNSVTAGVPVVVAAGNSAANACSFTPAGIPETICVGSTDRGDTRSTFSNFGTCVHVFAPGRDITSAWIGSNTATNTISGTSMACPHVAGYVAVLYEEDPDYTPAQIKSTIQDGANKGVIVNPGTGSPNNLLWNGCRPNSINQ
jgi:subtilisin family serine protease